MSYRLDDYEALLVKTVRAVVDRDAVRIAPSMIVGAGTNEIQRNVIAAQLIARGGL